MTVYTYVTADLRTGVPLASLPLTEVGFDEELNEPGSLSATLPLFGLQPQFIPQLRSVTMPGRTSLYVIADRSTVLWCGIIWKRRLRNHELSLEASGFLSYYARTRITTDALTFTDTDQFQIVRELLRYAHRKPGGDIGVDLGSGSSGILRDRAFKAADRIPVWDAVQAMAKLSDGFDIAAHCVMGATGVVSKYLDLGYPNLGRPAGNPDLMIEYPGTATEWEWPEEGDRMVTSVFVRGEKDAGTGADSSDSDTDNVLIDLGYPWLEDEFPAAAAGSTPLSVKQQATALLHALNHPITLPTFVVPSGASGAGGPSPMDYMVGDWFRVRVTDPEWFPAGPQGSPGLDIPMRLTRRSITLSADQGESAQLTFNPYPATQKILA